MSYAADLITDWKAEIERIRESIPLWESGRMTASASGVDVTAEHLQQLRWMLANLEKGVRVLQSEHDT